MFFTNGLKYSIAIVLNLDLNFDGIVSIKEVLWGKMYLLIS